MLTNLIEQSGKSREALCLEAGISRGLLSQIEKGSRRIGVARVGKLATALGVEPGILRPDLAEIFSPSQQPERVK